MMIFPGSGFTRVRQFAVGALCFGLSLMAARADEWTKITTPHFTVLSEASEGRTRDWAVEFELFRRGLSQVVPVEPSQVERVVLVLFSSDRRLKPFKPLENGKPSRVAGYFVRPAERNMIAISVAGARDDVREIIYHEGVHWYLAGLDQRPPLWLEEGLAEVFANFGLHGNAFSYGNPRPDYMKLIGVLKPMPMAKLAELSRGPLRYNGHHESTTRLFYAQSWAVVHQLMFDGGSGGTEVLRSVLQRPAGTGDIDAEIEAALGCSYSEIDTRLKDYLLKRNYQRQQQPFDRAEVEAGFSLERAEAAEVDLILGGLLLGVDRLDDAAPYLHRAAAARPSDPRPWEVLGQLEWARGDRAGATSYFEQALACGSDNALTHLYLGESELSPGVLSSGRLRVAAEHFEAAIRANPRYEPAYEGLARTVVTSREPGAGAGELLKEGARRFPSNPSVQLGLVVVDRQAGREDAARERLQRLMALPDLEPWVGKTARQTMAELDAPNARARRARE